MILAGRGLAPRRGSLEERSLPLLRLQLREQNYITDAFLAEQHHTSVVSCV